jgi:hypothetical protein
VQDLFAADGVWLRCCLHAHTTNSDGELALSALTEHYERTGFDAIAITDHHVRTVEPSRDRLLTIPGTELDARLGDGSPRAHVLALGVGPRRGARLHAGRLAYRHCGEVLEMDGDGRIPAARLARPAATSYARLEVVDARGRKAWTNPLP